MGDIGVSNQNLQLSVKLLLGNWTVMAKFNYLLNSAGKHSHSQVKIAREPRKKKNNSSLDDINSLLYLKRLHLQAFIFKQKSSRRKYQNGSEDAGLNPQEPQTFSESYCPWHFSVGSDPMGLIDRPK